VTLFERGNRISYRFTEAVPLLAISAVMWKLVLACLSKRKTNSKSKDK
jgi:hypothetical protein